MVCGCELGYRSSAAIEPFRSDLGDPNLDARSVALDYSGEVYASRCGLRIAELVGGALEPDRSGTPDLDR